MSHPLAVPEGWTKGEPLSVFGSWPPYALDRRVPSLLQDYLDRNPDPEKTFMITFDSKADLDSFLAWWHA